MSNKLFEDKIRIRGRGRNAIPNKAAIKKHIENKINKLQSFGKDNFHAWVKKAPEVFVKLTGSTKGSLHLRSHLLYLSRNGKVELEDNNGNKYQKKDLRTLLKNWQDNADLANLCLPKSKRTSTTIVFSMKQGTSEEAVLQAVKKIANEKFQGKFEYLIALHLDTKNPHVHLCLSATDVNFKKKLHISYANTEELRVKFAGYLREQGVEAAASPRLTRGISKKSEKIEVKKARERIGELEIDKKALLEVKTNKNSVQQAWTEVKKIENEYTKLAFLQISNSFLANNDFLLAEQLQKLIYEFPKVKTKYLENTLKIQEKNNQSIIVQ